MLARKMPRESAMVNKAEATWCAPNGDSPGRPHLARLKLGMSSLFAFTPQVLAQQQDDFGNVCWHMLRVFCMGNICC